MNPSVLLSDALSQGRRRILPSHHERELLVEGTMTFAEPLEKPREIGALGMAAARATS